LSLPALGIDASTAANVALGTVQRGFRISVLLLRPAVVLAARRFSAVTRSAGKSRKISWAMTENPRDAQTIQWGRDY
jgi:hypothetical protein